MTDTNQTGTQIAAFDIIMRAFRYVFEERSDFLSMAMLPVVGLALIGVGLGLVFPGPMIEMSDAGAPVAVSPGFFIQIGVTLVFYAMFAVAWYRKVLVPDEAATVGTALKWDNRKTRFLFRFLGIALLIGLAWVPVALLFAVFGAVGLAAQPIMILIMLAVAALVFARSSLWLPAASVDDPVKLPDVWRATRGNSWRLALLVIFPPLPVGLVQLVVAGLILSVLTGFGLQQSMTGDLVLSLIMEGISYFGIAVTVTALAMAYTAIRAAWQKPAS